MLTGGILTWFGMFGAKNASSDALQCICDLSMCCCCNYSFWLCFRGYAAMFDACIFIFDRWYPDMIWHVCCGMFWHVCFCQVVYWHVLANGCDLFTWTLLTGAILSSRQDTTRSCKNPEKKDAGLAAFEMFGLFQRTFSTPFDVFLLVHGIKLDDNHNLTTPTQHVMVGITRSKVIFLRNIFFLGTTKVHIVDGRFTSEATVVDGWYWFVKKRYCSGM